MQYEFWPDLLTVSVSSFPEHQNRVMHTTTPKQPRQYQLWFGPRLLAPIDVARAMGKSLQHIYYLIRMLRIPAIKVGHEWRIVPC
jgi:hypothetical protein